MPDRSGVGIPPAPSIPQIELEKVTMATIKFVRVERECDAGRRLHKVELNGWVFDAYYRDDGVMMLVGRGDPAEFDPPSPLHPDVIGLRADGRRLR